MHGLLGSSLESVLHQVNDFLIQHYREVVLLDFTNVHKNTKEEEMVEEGIINGVINIFGKKLCSKKLADKSLQHIWKHRCQLFAFYQKTMLRNNYGDNMTYICPKDMIWSPFDMQTFTQYSKWIKFLDNTYRMSSPYFHVIQGIMEPHWMEIAIAGISESATLKGWVSDHATSELVKWLHGKHNGRHGVNIVMADFIENHDFVDTVISLNTISTSNAKHFSCIMYLTLLSLLSMWYTTSL